MLIVQPRLGTTLIKSAASGGRETAPPAPVTKYFPGFCTHRPGVTSQSALGGAKYSLVFRDSKNNNDHCLSESFPETWNILISK